MEVSVLRLATFVKKVITLQIQVYFVRTSNLKMLLPPRTLTGTFSGTAMNTVHDDD